MTKLALVIPTFKQGGMERVMSELSSYWSQQGHEVHLVFLFQHESFYEVSNSIKKVYYPNFLPSKVNILKTVYYFQIKKWLYHTIKSIDPDTILAFGDNYHPLIIWSLSSLNISLYISNRENPINYKGNRKFLWKYLYPKSAGIISQTSFSKQAMYDLVRHQNIIAIPNPIKKINKKDIPRKNVIINIGRLVPQKDQSTLINIFASLNNKDWELHIIGDGGLKQDLLRQIESLNLREKVKILEPKLDISEYLSYAKIFAFTSITEGYPNALAEAVTFPVASISFDCNAGPRDIIQNGQNGFLIPVGDEQAYIEKLQLLIEDANQRNEFEKEGTKLLPNSSIEVIAEKFLSFITERG